MELNKRLFKGGISVIIIVLLVSIGISYYLRLDEPVFLKVYMEKYMPQDKEYHEDVSLEIKYITNIEDGRTVSFVEFQDYPELNVYSSEYGLNDLNFFYEEPGLGQDIGRYNVRTVYVYLDTSNLKDYNEEIHINKARMHFSDGETKDVDIGKLILYSDKGLSNYEHFQHISSSGRGDGSSSTREKIKEDIQLVKVEGVLLDQVKDFTEISIGNKDYRQIEGERYKSGSYLQIDTIFNKPDDAELKMYDYELKPKLIYRDGKGKEFLYRILNLHYYKREFTYKEILEFLKVGGKI